MVFLGPTSWIRLFSLQISFCWTLPSVWVSRPALNLVPLWNNIILSNKACSNSWVQVSKLVSPGLAWNHKNPAVLPTERINTREKLENYYKGQQNALDLLDYIEGKAFIRLTPEEQAKIATRMSISAGWSSWGTITTQQATTMYSTSTLM